MRLSQLIENHQVFLAKEGGLSTNLGDAFLLTKNRIYKNIRTQAEAAGFQYSLKKSEEDLALPLSQLKELLVNKTIPHTDNVSVLKKLENQNSQKIKWDEVRENLKRNYIFHESCHAVAFANRKKLKPTINNEPLECLWILLEESYANACELLGLVDAEDAIHKIFYDMNSYTFLNDERALLKLTQNEIGEKVLLKFIILAYLYSNYLYEKIEDSAFQRVLKIAGAKQPIEPKQMKLLRSISKIAFTLDENFRQKTTSFYLKICGFNSSAEKLFGFDFLSAIEGDVDLKNHLEQIANKALYKEASVVAE